MLNENIIKKFPNTVIGLRGKGFMLENKVENQVLE